MRRRSTLNLDIETGKRCSIDCCRADADTVHRRLIYALFDTAARLLDGARTLQPADHRGLLGHAAGYLHCRSYRWRVIGLAVIGSTPA